MSEEEVCFDLSLLFFWRAVKIHYCPARAQTALAFKPQKSSRGKKRSREVLRQSPYRGLAGCAATENPSDIVEDEVFSIEAAPPIELDSHRSLSLS